MLWVGAGTKDIGFSLTRLTFQMTHATDSDTNAERDYIINDLRKDGVIENVTLHKTGDQLLTENVNHYITDGDIALAELVEADRSRPRTSLTSVLDRISDRTLLGNDHAE